MAIRFFNLFESLIRWTFLYLLFKGFFRNNNKKYIFLTSRQLGTSRSGSLGPFINSTTQILHKFYKTSVVYNWFFAETGWANVQLHPPTLRWFIPSNNIFPLLFRQTKHSPSLRKASRINPRLLFSNWMPNYVMSVRRCLTSFCKKTNCILLIPTFVMKNWPFYLHLFIKPWHKWFHWILNLWASIILFFVVLRFLWSIWLSQTT